MKTLSYCIAKMNNIKKGIGFIPVTKCHEYTAPIYMIYLAAPFGEKDSEFRRNTEKAAKILEKKGFEVYKPYSYVVPNAWDYPNHEWGEMVFAVDMKEIRNAELVVVLSYGRESTAGTNWEAGFAFGIGKKVIVVEMTDNVMSLMIANGRWATVKGLNGLKDYDFNTMPKTRDYDTEQK